MMKLGICGLPSDKRAPAHIVTASLKSLRPCTRHPCGWIIMSVLRFVPHLSIRLMITGFEARRRVTGFDALYYFLLD